MTHREPSMLDAAAAVPDGHLPDFRGQARIVLVVRGAADLVARSTATAPEVPLVVPVLRAHAGEFLVAGSTLLAGWSLEYRAGADLEVETWPWRAPQEHEAAWRAWLGALVAATRLASPPEGYLTARTGVEEPLEEGRAAFGTERLAWLHVLAGAVDLFAGGAAPLTAGATVLVSRECWIRARGSARVRFDAFASAPEAVEEALLATQARLIALACAAQRAREQAHAARRERSARFATRRLRAVFDRLATLADGQVRPLDEVPSSDPLFAACALVTRALGFTARPLATGDATLAEEVRLAEWAERQRVRKRRVALRGAWWRHAGLPMVGFREVDRTPVALLPHGKGYRLIDATGGTEAPPAALDARAAASLAPFAYTFYRPFREGAVGALEVVRLALGGNVRELASALALSFALGLLGTLAPIATGYLFDRVIPAADRGQLFELAAALGGAALAVFGFSLLRAEFLLRLESAAEGTLQAAVWDRLLRLPLSFFRNYAVGDLVRRVSAIDQIHRVLTGTALVGILTGLFSFLNLAVLFLYSARLALLALVLVGAAFVVNASLAFVALRFERAASRLEGRLAGLVVEILSGITKLRTAGAEWRVMARWGEGYADVKSMSVRAARIHVLLDALMPTYMVAVTALFFYLIGTHAPVGSSAGHALSLGGVIAFSAAFSAFFINFIGFTDAVLSLLRVLPLLERARPLLVTPPEVDASSTDPGRLAGDIAVSSLTFRYHAHGPDVLSDVSFQARPGEFVALVGPSGCGKSTLLRLLLGFERAQSGSIFFDGMALGDLDVRALRAQMGVVLQTSQLIPGDIFSNIVGNRIASLDDAWQAARLAGLEADIRAMPMGMHTVLAEGASTLSGGQRQRLLIARALMRRPRIVLFDEATSALDNETQAIVTASLAHLQATRLVIAHRLSTVMPADRILVMQDGRIVQSGSYDELKNVPGLFRELAQRQLA